MRILLVGLCLAICSLGSLSWAAAPTITSFTPSSGPIGTVVTVNGSNLALLPTVKVNGTVATVKVTSITLTIAPGTTTGPISVTTEAGTVTSLTNFTVIPAPTISSFAPASGRVGTVVTLTGTNLTGASAVKFNGVAAGTISPVSATSLKATVPAGATSGKISVTTPGGTATSGETFTVVLAPIITSFTPTSGPIGTVVTIAGTNLTGASAVKFNGVAAGTITPVSAISLKATVPTGATSGKISVTTPGGTATSGETFTVVLAPTITSFTPTSGPIGTVVTIAGTNLTGASAVKFNGVAATTITPVSATSLKATIPIGATTGKIAVTTPGGTATSSGTFTVAPTIRYFSPTNGPIGTVVTITGTNLAGVNSVKFNGVAATTVTPVSATSLKATVPTGATTGKVVVTTPGGMVTSIATFTVLVAPTITSFTPSIGPIGTVVTITGTKLTGASAVKFNGVAATTITPVSATSLKATVPAGATTGKIAITTPGGTGTSSGTFTVEVAQKITLNATIATIDPGAQRIFIATVIGLTNKNLTWTTDPLNNAGTIEVLDATTVVYTAPLLAGTYKLIAISVENPNVKSTVTITVPATPIQKEIIFDNGNIGTVQNGPSNPTTFTIPITRHITYVSDYHYFNNGVLPGTIAFKHSDGTIYGPWQTTGMLGQGGVLNAYWICYPNIDIKAGIYTVIDSDPSTWSQNSESNYCGFTYIEARIIP